MNNNIGSSKNGGAINNSSDIQKIENTYFFDNVASAGGAIINNASSSCKIGTIDSSAFVGNNGIGGSAIYSNVTSSMSAINNSYFIGNATNRPGTILLNRVTLGSITSSKFIANKQSNAWSGDLGGATISMSGQINLIKDCEFIGNETEINGGAIQNSYYDSAGSATINTIQNTVFIGNKAQKSGGAIWVGKQTSSSYTAQKLGIVTNSTFLANDSGEYGGAIYLFGVVNDKIEDSKFIANTAKSGGGAIYNVGNITNGIKNSVFFNNTVTNGNGGAIYSNNNLKILSDNGNTILRIIRQAALQMLYI